MKRTTNDRPLLKRLKLSSRPSITLSQKQLSAIADFRRAVSTGNYKFTPNPCLCGSASDILVASRDRYGLNVTTKLCNSCGLLRTDPYFDSQSLVHFYDDHYRNIYLNKSQDASFLFEKDNKGKE